MYAQSLYRGEEISTQPFYVYTIENFFDEKIYDELCSTFPKREWFSDLAAGNKLRLNVNHEEEKFNTFVSQSKPWHTLISFLSGKEFLTELHGLVSPHLKGARGVFHPKRWNVGGAPIGKGVFSQDVRLNFEFSRLERGSSVPAHTDAPEKIVSIILYFADPQWKNEYGGGTVFYKTKSAQFEHNWFNRKTPLQELSPFFECPFEKNRFLLFLKSKNSYHGVTTLESPRGLPRNSLNVNIFTKPSKFKKWEDLKRRLHKRFEQRYWQDVPRLN